MLGTKVPFVGFMICNPGSFSYHVRKQVLFRAGFDRTRRRRTVHIFIRLQRLQAEFMLGSSTVDGQPRGRGLNLVKDSSSEILVKDSQIRLQFVSVLPSSLSKVVLLSSLENEMDGL